MDMTTQFPSTDWAACSPDAQGIDPGRLAEALEYLDAEARGCGADETVVIRNGYLIWKGPEVDRVHSINSGTKTFTTTVLGLLCQDGKLSLDARAVEYVPAIADRYPSYSEITLEHLATMTSGYDGEKGELTETQPWGDPERYLEPSEPLFPAGSAYKYHDPGVHLLGYILTEVAGEPLSDFYRRRIGAPIGFTDWTWTDYGVVDGILYNNPSGIYEGGIHTSARQLARHGLLYLNRGSWAGAQLLDPAWVDLATANRVPTSLDTQWFDLRGHYGIMWWTNGVDANGKRPWPSAPEQTYAAVGAGRNYCFVIPEWQMVVVRMDGSESIGRNRSDAVLDEFLGGIGAAFV